MCGEFHCYRGNKSGSGKDDRVQEAREEGEIEWWFQ